jgi:hypothetical protein
LDDEDQEDGPNRTIYYTTASEPNGAQWVLPVVVPFGQVVVVPMTALPANAHGRLKVSFQTDFIGLLAGTRQFLVQVTSQRASTSTNFTPILDTVSVFCAETQALAGGPLHSFYEFEVDTDDSNIIDIVVTSIASVSYPLNVTDTRLVNLTVEFFDMTTGDVGNGDMALVVNAGTDNNIAITAQVNCQVVPRNSSAQDVKVYLAPPDVNSYHVMNYAFYKSISPVMSCSTYKSFLNGSLQKYTMYDQPFLLENSFFGDLWSGIKQGFKTVAPLAGMVLQALPDPRARAAGTLVNALASNSSAPMRKSKYSNTSPNSTLFAASQKKFRSKSNELRAKAQLSSTPQPGWGIEEWDLYYLDQMTVKTREELMASSVLAVVLQGVRYPLPLCNEYYMEIVTSEPVYKNTGGGNTNELDELMRVGESLSDSTNLVFLSGAPSGLGILELIMGLREPDGGDTQPEKREDEEVFRIPSEQEVLRNHSKYDTADKVHKAVVPPVRRFKQNAWNRGEVTDVFMERDLINEILPYVNNRFTAIAHCPGDGVCPRFKIIKKSQLEQYHSPPEFQSRFKPPKKPGSDPRVMTLDLEKDWDRNYRSKPKNRTRRVVRLLFNSAPGEGSELDMLMSLSEDMPVVVPALEVDPDIDVFNSALFLPSMTRIRHPDYSKIIVNRPANNSLEGAQVGIVPANFKAAFPEIDDNSLIPYMCNAYPSVITGKVDVLESIVIVVDVQDVTDDCLLVFELGGGGKEGRFATKKLAPILDGSREISTANGSIRAYGLGNDNMAALSQYFSSDKGQKSKMKGDLLAFSIFLPRSNGVITDIELMGDDNLIQGNSASMPMAAAISGICLDLPSTGVLLPDGNCKSPGDMPLKAHFYRQLGTPFYLAMEPKTLLESIMSGRKPPGMELYPGEGRAIGEPAKGIKLVMNLDMAITYVTLNTGKAVLEAQKKDVQASRPMKPIPKFVPTKLGPAERLLDELSLLVKEKYTTLPTAASNVSEVVINTGVVKMLKAVGLEDAASKALSRAGFRAQLEAGLPKWINQYNHPNDERVRERAAASLAAVLGEDAKVLTEEEKKIKKNKNKRAAVAPTGVGARRSIFASDADLANFA